MKYNININQKILSEFEELDIKDMAIFDYIKTMCSSVNEKIESKRFDGHTWINYETLIKDMPALRIKSRNSITPRINNIEKAGLITVVKKMVSGHRRVFVKMTTLSDNVFVEPITRVRETEKRVRETVQDSYTKDNNTKDNNTKLAKQSFAVDESEKKNIQEIMKIFYDTGVNPTLNFGNKTQRKYCKMLIDKFTFVEVEKIATASCQFQGSDFCPTITTPKMLYDKIGQLKIFFDRMNKTKVVKKVIPKF